MTQQTALFTVVLVNNYTKINYVTTVSENNLHVLIKVCG